MADLTINLLVGVGWIGPSWTELIDSHFWEARPPDCKRKKNPFHSFMCLRAYGCDKHPQQQTINTLRHIM